MPNLSDFDAAMMQPALSVPAVRRLGGGSIRLNEHERPLRADGRDAVVYEMRTPSGRILVLRCLRQADAPRDRALSQRYHALRGDPRLETLRGSDAPLPRDIQWIEDGIALRGADLQRITLPLIVMERVPGRTMARAVDRLCREGQSGPIALLADSWLTTAAALDEVGFRHGDLAADNLIVRPDGSLAVIDLDTASWPTAPAGPPAPDGAPGYIHPRGALTLPAQRDRFPALILWASLRILARHPALRERWGDHPDRHGATLLWSHDDLRRPERSPLFAALDALDDKPLQPLLEIMRRAIRFSADETPPLAEIAERLDSLGLPRLAAPEGHSGRRRPTPGLSVMPAPLPAPSAISQPWGDEVSVSPVLDGAQTNRISDAAQTTNLRDRERRLAAVQRLGAAIASRDMALVSRLWHDCRTIPEASTYAAMVHGMIADGMTATIDRAIRRGDDGGLVAAVAEAEHTGVAPSFQARKALRAARERIAARTTLLEAADRADYATLGSLKHRGALACLGRLEPGLDRAVQRAVAWPLLQRALVSDDDIAIASAADPTLWREEASLPTEAWQRLDLARRRLRWLDDTRAALRRRDGTALRAFLAGAPAGAVDGLTEVESRRILRVTVREAAVARLERALRQGPDREVVAALAEFEAAAAPFSDVLDWAAVRGVVDRLSLADALRIAATSDPPDTATLARLLPAARAALGEGSDSSGPDWGALEETVLRAAHLARLREAIASGDHARIASAADPDPYNAASWLSSSERAQVAQALGLHNRRSTHNFSA